MGKQTYETQRREALQRMDSELKKAGVETDAQRPLPATRKKPVRTESQQKLYRADLALISGIGFYIGIKYKDNEFFTTSLYKIDRIIEEKENP